MQTERSSKSVWSPVELWSSFSLKYLLFVSFFVLFMHINIQWNSDEKYTKWFHTIAQQLHSNVKTKPKSKVIKKKKSGIQI